MGFSKFSLCFLILLSSYVCLAQQASSVSSSWNSSTSLHITWANGVHGESLVVVSAQNEGNITNPGSASAGTGYGANTNYGAAPETAAGSGDKMVYFGSGTSVDVTNIFRDFLGGQWVYTIKVYDINTVNIGGFLRLLPNTSDAFQNPRDTEGKSPEPEVQANGATVNSYTNNSITFSWSPGSGTGRLALVYTSPIVGGPADGIDYGVDPSYGATAVSGVGYTVSTGNTNSVTVTNLAPGTGYYLKVYEYYDVSGLARNYTLLTTSNATSQLTLANVPVAVSATFVQGAGFQANWNSASGAANYRLDVSTSNTFAGGLLYNQQLVSGTSFNVTGVSPNTTYYYRVQAENAAGQTASSNTITQLSAPAAPVLNTSSGFGQTGFTATWNASAGATGYFLDVSTVNTFSSFVAGYNNLSVAGLSQAVNGLSPGVTYYIRVRATNGSSLSVDSSTGTALTIPPTPTGSVASAFGQTSFTASWNASTSATGYFLDVSAVSNFASFVASFNNLPVTGTSQSVTGLAAGTTYYFRVRSKNASGTSPNSAAISALTVPPTPSPSAASSILSNGFTANWSAATSATGYRLDVSTVSNFAVLVPSYDDLTVAGTSLPVTLLTPGTTYYYRIRSVNASGTSPNSATSSAVLTIPAPPGALAASAVSSLGFTANWNASTGASGYRLDVSTVSNFATLVPSYGDLTVAGTSQSVTPLTPGTTYYYRVRAVNVSGVSLNSGSISVLTVPATPAAPFADGVMQVGFTVNWSAVAGATEYRLDVSDNNFTSLLPDYNNLTVTGTSHDVTGLTPGTLYQFRIRSANSTGASTSSPSGSKITIPSTPVTTAFTGATASAFLAHWNAVAGVASYKLEVSDASNFNVLLPGYPLSTTNTTEPVSTLSPSKPYWYRVRATNAGGDSPYSNVTVAITTDALGQTNSLSLAQPSTDNTIAVSGGSETVTTQSTGGFGTVVVKFFHRKITETDFTAEVLTLTNGHYESPITSSMSDSQGVEFYFSGTDVVGETETDHDFKYVTFDDASSPAIPFASAGSYEMFSVPYVIDNKDILSVFDEKGAYDKTKWRLFHYQGGLQGSYKEFQNGLNNIETGKGYWYITNEKVDIKPGAGMVSQGNQSTPVTINFEEGWNQIGNPYLFNISWDEIDSLNPDRGLNSLWVYESGTYVNKTVLAPWKGAFVYAEHAGAVSFPISSKTNQAGRQSTANLSTNPDEAAWEIPITLELGQRRQRSSIGMHPDAADAKDRFDKLSVPRFVEYLELNTLHTEFPYPYFSTDVVTPRENWSWLFTASSSIDNGRATLRWELTTATAGLALIDLLEGTMIDMKTHSEYSFNWTSGRQFKIVYSRHGEINPGITLLGSAYPNPFRQVVTIPVLLENDQQALQIRIYDLMGRKVRTLSAAQVPAGIYSTTWDGLGDQGVDVISGCYLYQLWGDGRLLAPVKRLIKD